VLKRFAGLYLLAVSVVLFALIWLFSTSIRLWPLTIFLVVSAFAVSRGLMPT
jgi:hypothetical protein